MDRDALKARLQKARCLKKAIDTMDYFKGLHHRCVLDRLAATDMRTDMRTVISAEKVQFITETNPFISLSMVYNLRDAGLVADSAIPPGRVYHCGGLADVTQDSEAEEWLKAHVRHIYGLDPIRLPDLVIDGVTKVWNPTSGTYPNPTLADFAGGKVIDVWKTTFFNIALSLNPTFRAVLEQVRDLPQEPMLIHGDVGYHRTAILAGLLHHLAGSPPTAARRDYMLSRVGVEPIREGFIEQVMEDSKIKDRETPGFWNFMELRREYWDAFVTELNERFGGWDGYVTADEGLGFSKKDLKIIKVNMRTVFPGGK